MSWSPIIGNHYEPLCAIYSKRCLPYIEDQLDRDDFAIINFFQDIHLKTIPAQRIQSADDEMISFYNVNTPDALKASQEMVSAKT